MVKPKITQVKKSGTMSLESTSAVTIRVGKAPNTKDFIAHEAFLTSRSEFFRRAMNGNWKEAKTRIITNTSRTASTMNDAPPPYYSDYYYEEHKTNIQAPNAQNFLSLFAIGSTSWAMGALYVEYVYIGIEHAVRKYLYQTVAIPFTLFILGALSYVCATTIAKWHPNVTKYILALPVPTLYVATFLSLASFVEVGHFQLDLIFVATPCSFLVIFLITAGVANLLVRDLQWHTCRQSC
ncbi:unnamed protein product [Alternaria sp. RS040]